MPPNPAKPVLKRTKGKSWENWHQTVKGKVKERIELWNGDPDASTFEGYRATNDVLKQLMAQARDEQVSFRAVGGGWSFSPIAFSDGLLLNTMFINYRFRARPEFMHANSTFQPANLKFLQCGNSIARLNEVLVTDGKSLKTSGASNGQTIAGALSTGVHGSALHVGSIQETVRALHVVTGPDDHVWLERATQPVFADSFAQSLGARVIRDDAMFNAALVSFGCFGFIHGVVLEIEDQFFLQVFRFGHALDENLWRALSALDFSALPLPRGPDGLYHFQVVINPNDIGWGPRVTVMYKRQTIPADSHPVERGSQWGPGDDAAEVIGKVFDLTGNLTMPIVNKLVRELYKDIDNQCGKLGEIFSNTRTRGKNLSCAMGVPLANVRTALEALLAMNKSNRFPGLFALRFVKGTDATLGFTHFKPHTCILEMDGPESKAVRKFYDLARDKFIELGIPFTYHWGKMQSVNSGLLMRQYGQNRIDEWKGQRKSLIPDAAIRKVFENQMVRDLGLDG